MTITEGQMKHYTGLADDAKRWEDLRSLILVARDAARTDARYFENQDAYREYHLRRQGATAGLNIALDIIDSLC